MFVVLALIVALIAGVVVFLRLPMFGKRPSGERLKRIEKSVNYKNGAFQNLSPTPNFAENVGFFTVFRSMVLKKRIDKKPLSIIPTEKTDLSTLDAKSDVVVWFGHSSCFVQLEGKKILIDPVFGGNASPLPFMLKAFNGSNIYSCDDIPETDLLVITHDHWDHLDLKTIRQLKTKIKHVVCPLGNGAHLEHWGIDKNIIFEQDWNDQFELCNNLVVHTLPSRHFSGRGPKRNKALWASFVLQTPNLKIFISGDGGYDKHFAEIGEKFGGFDLAILENGQYNVFWRYIHLLPDDVVQAAIDLKAKRVLPVHHSKFALSNHPWNEPLTKLAENSVHKNIQIITPKIGEMVNLNDPNQEFLRWWEDVK
ncbi:MAG: MBL fold metallo-hydrolase [Bacteroidetes bacterium HGW-Bacteroidetes-6]|nr:MAG: MBL fold metallo-hydrolase [Bacteroidetes bacterium HGW-Bacteroidetes-6]